MSIGDTNLWNKMIRSGSEFYASLALHLSISLSLSIDIFISLYLLDFLFTSNILKYKPGQSLFISIVLYFSLFSPSITHANTQTLFLFLSIFVSSSLIFCVVCFVRKSSPRVQFGGLFVCCSRCNKKAL